MQIVPLSLVTKDAYSPNRVKNHHDSLVFSITSEKINSRKQTLLLDESKEMKKTQDDSNQRDYFKIQDKIKLLEEKVQNIKTQYCQSQRKQDDESQKQNISNFINLEFPEQIYLNKHISPEEQNSIGKIKRKKQPKYFTGMEPKIRNKSRSIQKNQDSFLSTKRINHTTENINDFSVYITKNSASRNNQTLRQMKQLQRERSSSLVSRKKSGSLSKEKNFSELKRLKGEITRNRLSNEKLSRKSKQSQRKFSVSKEQAKKLKSQNSIMEKELMLLKQKLKRSEMIKQRQKQTIQKQKQQIQELKIFLEEVLKRNNDMTLRESQFGQRETKMIKLKKLR